MMTSCPVWYLTVVLLLRLSIASVVYDKSHGNAVHTHITRRDTELNIVGTQHQIPGDACSSPRVLSQSEGVFSSPSAGGASHKYPSDTDICWVIDATQGQQIYLLFHNFAVEGDTECTFDWVRVYGGEGEEHLGVYCGDTSRPADVPGIVPPPLISASGRMVVWFHSDFSVEKEGFSAEYRIGSPPQPNPDPGCEVIEAGDTEVLAASSSYPGYENGLHQCWIIHAQYNHKVVIFTSFALEGGDGCPYDKVTIRRGINKQGELLSESCGYSPPDDVTIPQGESLYVLFTTDDSETETGFEFLVFDANNVEISVDGASGSGGIPGSEDVPVCGVPHHRPHLQPATADSRIVGGYDAIPNSWPWQISLRYAGYGHVCGGSIIHRRWVITAAHCVTFGAAEEFEVMAGDENIHDDGEPGEQLIPVHRILVHDRYTINMTDGILDDIALIELSHDVIYTDAVQPVCLSDRHSKPEPGSNCWATGWGWVQGDHAGENKLLQQISLPILSNRRCQSVGSHYQYVTDGMLCAGLDPGYGGCKGDSGGPLVCQDAGADGGFTLYGLTSWGNVPCAQENNPTVYTRVTKYIPWIREKIREASNVQLHVHS